MPALALQNGRAARAGVLVGLLLLLTMPLMAAPGTLPAGPITPAKPGPLPYAHLQSVFHISKSENRNEVHYAVLVDAACRPTGRVPLYGYWREFEKGPNVVSPLLSHEQPAYGLSAPRSIQLTANGGQVRISLRGFPERPLMIETARYGKVCGARALTTIQGRPAMLNSIYVKIGFLFSVEYAIARGLRMTDGVAVEERVHD
jgi:hypothetical protein